MAVKIRLKRLGKIRSPHYRIVVADSRTKRDGRVIEEIGRYIPTENPSFIEVNSERAQYWLSVGAQPTEQVTALLKLTGDYQASKGEKATNMVQVKEAKPEFVVDSAKKAVLLPKVEKKAPVVEAVVEEAPAAEVVQEVSATEPSAEGEAPVADAEVAAEEAPVAEEAPAEEAEAEAPAEAAAEEVAEEAPAEEAEAEAPAEAAAEEVSEEAPAAEAEAPAEEA